MRLLFLVTLLMTFVAAGVGNSAFSAVADIECNHHQTEHDHSEDLASEPCDVQQSQGSCDDCCCAHVHVMTVIQLDKIGFIPPKQVNSLAPPASYKSADLSALRSPPRL